MGGMDASTTVARIAHGEQVAELTEGGQLRLGRSSTNEVRVGCDGPEGPEDLGVSRTAATVSVRDGRLWVRNDSSSQPLYLVPDVGPTRVLEGRDEIASLPTEQVTLQFRGRIRTHEVVVELSGPEPEVDRTPTSELDGPATQFLLEFTPAERRIVTALCEPLLVARGDRARPASYAEGAARLFLSRSRVENCVADVVKKYAAAGVPGLEGPDAKDNLCRYAVRSGSIVPGDLSLLD